MALASLLLCSLTLVGQSYRERFPLPDLTVPSGWGVNIHFFDPAPGEMESIRAGGFKWIRQDLFWHQVETEKGKYDFEPLSRLFDACDRQGIRPLIILDYGNDLYQPGSPRTPESRAAFCRMIEALVTRFKGRGALWEMWNEPNIHFWQPSPNVEEYILLATEVGKTIRGVAPEEYYVGPATSGFDWGFIERCFEAGLLEYWDAVTVHPYRQNNPETALPDWARLRGLIDRHAKGRKIPMLSGEWGYSELYSGNDRDRQGLYITRQYLTNLMAGVPLSIWYDWKDDGLDPKEVEHHFGTVTTTLEPKPAYLAAQSLAKELDGYTYHLRFAQKSRSDYLIAFRKGQDLKYVSWTDRRIPTILRLPHGETVPASESPKVVAAPKGRATTLVLGWRALPASLAVGSEQEAKDAAERLKQGLPKGALVQLPKIEDDPGAQDRWIRVRVATGDVAVEQEVAVIQSRPITLHPIALPSGVRLTVRNPGGREIEGTLHVSAGKKAVNRPIRLDRQRLEATVEFTDLPSDQPASFWIEPAGKKGQKIVELRNVSFLRLGDFNDETFHLQDEGAPDLKGTYEVKPGAEVRIRYSFPAGWKFFMLQPKGRFAQPLKGHPESLNMMVWGDGSGDLLRMRFTDSAGQTFQPDAGAITWKGWKAISIPLRSDLGGHWGGPNDGIIRYPIRIEAFALVDSPGGRGGKGEVAFRDVSVVTR